MKNNDAAAGLLAQVNEIERRVSSLDRNRAPATPR